MGPDWLGSPQHFVGGLVLALLVGRVARRVVAQWWLVVVLAIGTTATAEIVVELVEYPLLYSGRPNVTAYWDTVADLAATLAGAVAGGVLSLARRGTPSAR